MNSTDEILAEVKKLLGRVKCTRQRIADKSGMSKSWIDKFAQGRVANPQIDSIVALKDALISLESKQIDNSIIKESSKAA